MNIYRSSQIVLAQDEFEGSVVYEIPPGDILLYTMIFEEYRIEGYQRIQCGVPIELEY